MSETVAARLDPFAGEVARGEQRGAWVTTFVSMGCLAISTGYLYMFGFFIDPLQHAFGWTRAQIGSGLLISSFVSIVLAPFVGLAIDRFGIRRIALGGIALYCLGIMSFATANGSLWLWSGLWVMFALGSALVKPTVWVAAVSRQFDKRRAFALGVMLCGSGIGAAVLPFVTTHLIATHGWRFAYVALGAGFAAIALPLLFFFFKENPRIANPDDAGRPPALPGLPIQTVLRSSRFARLAASAFLLTVAMAGMNVHFVAYVTAHGLPPGQAALAISSIGLTSVLGRLLTGYLLDRFNGPLVGSVSFALPLISCLLWYRFDGSMVAAFVIASTFGFALGAENDVIGYLGTRYFGLKNYGTIFGTIIGVIVLGQGLGPTVAGFIYDRTHSYDLFIGLAAASFVLASLLTATLGRYPDFASDEDL